jgi:dihydrolipoamide dehydrogenase
VGDLIATAQLAHVAYAEAILAVKNMRNEVAFPVDYDRVPWAIYCHPEVAWAGPSEEDAKTRGIDVVVAKHQFRANSRAMIIGDTDGLVKVIAKKNRDGSAGQVLGVHMVGPWVTEQLSGGYLAVNWEATRSSSPTRVSANCSARPYCLSPDAASTHSSDSISHDTRRRQPWQRSPFRNSARP